MTEFLELLHNPAHWGFELVSDLIFTAIGYPTAKWRVRAHDRKVHKK